MKFTHSGLLPHYFTCLIRIITGGLSTVYSRFYIKYWGITCGRGCSFGGIPIIRRHPKSIIMIGDNCKFLSSTRYNSIGINHPFVISTHNTNAKLSIGNSSGFSGTTIACANKVTIGNNVRCGANTTITDTDWHPDDPRTSKALPIIIEDNVWLSANVTILKGVKIGANSFIGAGSIVTSDIPAGVIAAGVPAKVIKLLNVRSPKKSQTAKYAIAP